MLGRGLAGRTLGIVGAGRIGREVARLAEALGMHTATAGRDDALDEVLGADVVSLHVPLTDATRHLIDEGAFGRMRSSAVLVNTSRGPVVDEDALVRALRAGLIAGAALDVFEDEPRVHPGLLELDNVVLTPHLGSATHEAREAMGMLCVDALRAVLLEGRRPEHALR
jgi:lactate dehydrogenase-like 2-hydroxyacid dehydrogenase